MLGFIEAECILMRLDLERHGTWHTATTWSFSQSVGGNLIYLSLFLSNYLLVFTATCVCPRSLGAIAYHFPYCFEVIWCKRNAASVYCSPFIFIRIYFWHSTIQLAWLLPGLVFFQYLLLSFILFIVCIFWLFRER